MMLLTGLALLLAIGFRAQAQDVLDVVNAGFEDDSFSGNISVPNSITGWSSPLSSTPYNNVGLATSSYHSFTGDTSGDVAALGSYIPTSFGGFPATIIQTGISSVNPSDIYYTFTVGVAQDSSHPYSSGSFTLTLSDGSSVVAQQTFSTSVLENNNFQDFSVTGYAPSASSFTIGLSATGHGEILADNVKLTGSAVPEPSDWGWVPFLGTISFLVYRRFRMQAVKA
ncbi:MAG: hypothetical protein LV479_04745 [Methylacidiphilales bacterium]|nr:hypothetical protein [Candidatus Methylacidiphilales bacterium]